MPDTTTHSGPVAVDDLVAERGRVFARMEDLVTTAREDGDGGRPLTDAERAEFDQSQARFDELTEQISEANLAAADANRAAGLDARRGGLNVPNINRISTPPAGANRSLDELLWATAESVPAGSFGRTGQFVQHSAARNAVEQVIIRGEGDTAVAAPRIGDFMPQHHAAIRNFQTLVADMALFGLLLDPRAHSSRDGFEVARSHRLMRPRWEHALRALDVDTSAEGTEWVPTGIGASLHEQVRAAGRVAALFARINLPTNPWKWPLEGADATAYRVAEPTSDTATKVTASTPGTGAATFDAEIFGARTLFSRSLEADSALAILPYARMKLVRAFVDGEEKAILDGDSDSTHQDADVETIGDTDMRTAWDGLRKKALAQTTVTATSTTAANLGLLRAGMGKWGLNPADLAFIVGVSAMHDILADTSVLTVDKMGPQATILNGQIASIHGVPIVVSEHVREDLNASGVEDGITSTKTYNLCVNRQEWAMGQRMALDVEVDDSIYRETFQRVVIAFQREDFQSIATAATNDDTAISFNVTP